MNSLLSLFDGVYVVRGGRVTSLSLVVAGLILVAVFAVGVMVGPGRGERSQGTGQRSHGQDWAPRKTAATAMGTPPDGPLPTRRNRGRGNTGRRHRTLAASRRTPLTRGSFPSA